ncbi:MAG: methyltransferase domain-containing protein [Candidatus Omnitrophica bacterium]|nr:methyltransferase domain-containing protein [Candidatus Omnitrophota bacterium]
MVPVLISEENILQTIGNGDIQRMVTDAWNYIELDEPLIRRRDHILKCIQDASSFWNIHSVLAFIAHTFQPEAYLEIGMRTGGSLVQVVHHSNVKQVIAVDLWEGSYANLPNSLEYAQRQVAHYKTKTDKKFNIEFMQGNSHVILKHLIQQKNTFDLITVDGDHSENGALEDLEDAVQLLSERGIIIFDDIMHPSHSYLLRVANRFKERHTDFNALMNRTDDNGCAIFLKDETIQKWHTGHVTKEVDTEEVACPLCGLDDYREARGSDIVTCNNCGFTYLRVRPTEKWMEEYYSHVYAVNCAKAASPVRLPENIEIIETEEYMQARREKFLSETLDAYGKDVDGKKIIDVGCGWGGLLYTARKYNLYSVGYEFNVPNVHFGKEKLSLDIRSEHFTKAKLNAASVDFVTFVHSLEHLSDPGAALQKAFKILKKGGIVAGIVPNFGSFLSTFLKEQWIWLERNWHYSHFVVDSLQRLLEKSGFEIIKLYTVSGDYGEEEVLKNIEKHFPGKTREIVAKMLRNIECDGRGEEVRFFAQRKK